jgi:hypothetical protein
MHTLDLRSMGETDSLRLAPSLLLSEHLDESEHSRRNRLDSL